MQKYGICLKRFYILTTQSIITALCILVIRVRVLFGLPKIIRFKLASENKSIENVSLRAYIYANNCTIYSVVHNKLAHNCSYTIRQTSNKSQFKSQQ